MDDLSPTAHDIGWIVIAFFSGWWFVTWLWSLRSLFMIDRDDEIIVYQEMTSNGLHNSTYLECVQFSDMISGEQSFDVHTKRLTAHLKSATLTQLHPSTESTSSTSIPSLDQRNAYQLTLNLTCSSGCVIEVLVGVPRSELRRLRYRASHHSPTRQSQLGLSERRVSPSAQSESTRIVGRLNRVYSIKQEFDSNAILLNSQTTTSESSNHTPSTISTSHSLNLMLPMSSINTCLRDRSLMPITIQISNAQTSRTGGEMQELVCFKFVQPSDSDNQSVNRQTDHIDMQLHSAVTYDPRIHSFVALNDVFGINRNDQSECVICLSEPKRVMIGPCRHVCVCSECYRSFTAQKCPICRTGVKWTMEFT